MPLMRRRVKEPELTPRIFIDCALGFQDDVQSAIDAEILYLTELQELQDMAANSIESSRIRDEIEDGLVVLDQMLLAAERFGLINYDPYDQCLNEVLPSPVQVIPEIYGMDSIPAIDQPIPEPKPNVPQSGDR